MPELQSALEIALHRHALERQLRESERQLNTVLSSIGDAVVAANAEGLVQLMNPVGEALTGWTAAEARGACLSDVVCLEVPGQGHPLPALAARAQTEMTRLPLPPESTCHRRDGSSTWVDGHVSPLLDDHGQALGVVLVLRDVSEQRRAEAKIHHQRQQLEEQSERLRALNEITTAAFSSLQLDVVFQRLMELTVRALDAQIGLVFVQDTPQPGAAPSRLFLVSRVQAPSDAASEQQNAPPATQGWVPLAWEQAVARATIERARPLCLSQAEAAAIGQAAASDDECGALPTFETVLCAPLRQRDQPVGALIVAGAMDREDAAGDLDLLKAVAAAAAGAMENARLYVTMSGRAEELRLLNEIAMALTSTLDSTAIMRAALLHIQHLFKAGSVSFLQTDSRTGQLRSAYSLRGAETLEVGQAFPCGEEIVAWVLERGEPLVIEDAQADPRWPREIDAWLGWPARALMCAPLAMPGRVIGLLEVVGDVPGIYDRTTLRTLQAIASTLYVALQNARLYDELRQALQEREAAQAQLIQAEKMAALGKLVASIAHEINNPLQAVHGCLSLAGEELHGAQRLQRLDEYLNIASAEIERIATTMARLRDFYRPARAGFAPTDLHTLLHSVMALVAKPLRDAGIRVEHHLAKDVPIIHANADQLRQVFLNLILNAIEAMPQGGQLTVRTAPGQIQAADVDEPRPAVQIEFSDTGVGMSPEVQARLFEPLFTTKERGAGLGLAISYNIVRAHEGEIRVESQPGAGTTLTLVLPVSPSATGPLPDPYGPIAY